jgi:hypothetical protein
LAASFGRKLGRDNSAVDIDGTDALVRRLDTGRDKQRRIRHHRPDLDRDPKRDRPRGGGAPRLN